LLKWIVNDNNYSIQQEQSESIDWPRAIPFILLHLSCLLVFYVGFSYVACITAFILYVLRLFFIGAFYHRYFSHKTYLTSRGKQFIFALLGGSCAQRGPLWWAAQHRQHHLVADQPLDMHSPVQHGFWWSHMGWFLSKKHYTYNPARVKDLMAYPELVFLDRYDVLMPAVLFFMLAMVGIALEYYAPHLATGPGKMLVWGFSISTTLLFHTTVTINSLSHLMGRKPYPTRDNSGNHWFLALLTLGEGWHNNHHYYPVAARQGFVWWELDITYYLLVLMEKLGLIWNLNKVPKAVLSARFVKEE
jgi:stearoyl-CoA desaturase (delta-9 desaturase)